MRLLSSMMRASRSSSGAAGGGVAVPTVKLRQYVLLHRPGKLVQTRQTARVQELGEAGYGHGKFNKPVNTGLSLQSCYLDRNSSALRESSMGEHDMGLCGRVIPVYAEIVGGYLLQTCARSPGWQGMRSLLCVDVSGG